MPYLEDTPTGCRLSVHVQPKARRTAFAGLHGDAVKVLLDAPPVDGKANEALCRFVAEVCGIAPSHVSVLRGAKSRRKVVAVEASDARDRLRRALGDVGIPLPDGAPSGSAPAEQTQRSTHGPARTH